MQSLVELKTVQSSDIPKVWNEIVPLLNRLVEYDDDVTLEGIQVDLLERKKQLWTATDQKINAVALTQIYSNSKSKVCLLFGCAGDDLSEWVGFMPVIEAWATSIGCDRMELRGRTGWVRVLKNNGWVVEQVVLRKELNG